MAVPQIGADTPMDRALAATAHLFKVDLPKYEVERKPQITPSVADLPLIPVNGNSPGQKHIVDVIADVEPDHLDLDNIELRVLESGIADLPSPISLRHSCDLDHKMQFFVVNQAIARV